MMMDSREQDGVLSHGLLDLMDLLSSMFETVFDLFDGIASKNTYPLLLWVWVVLHFS